MQQTLPTYWARDTTSNKI